MNLKWSISDTQHGARTIEEIFNMSQLSKKKINTIVTTKSAHYEAWLCGDQLGEILYLDYKLITPNM